MNNASLGAYKNINDLVNHKTSEYASKNKDFKSLFELMFSERENVMAEISDGFRIKKITYGECYDKIYSVCASLSELIPDGGTVGIYMSNSIEWIEIFWAVLMSGNKPLLLNIKLADSIIENVLTDYSVKAVISDGKTFSVATYNYKLFTENNSRTFSPVNREFGKRVIFMSSGTTDSVKLCEYSGENFYYQICDSAYIIQACPLMKEHYEGNLKQLTLLPFYHVFGFIAVYLWFAFYSRTFVFLKDLNPQTVLNTIKRHKVTHIFAVPMVWDAIYRQAINKIKARGEKTYKKFTKALNLSFKLGALGKAFSKSAFKEIRENLFGDSIKFMISGGSFIAPETLKFFNGIGYHLVNGYGMTEIGITSVELSSSRKTSIKASIGKPFPSIQYRINDAGELEVKSKSRATTIITAKNQVESDLDGWFNTKDLMANINGSYFTLGRKDDLIICDSGENLNPQLAESKLNLRGCDFSIFASVTGVPTLLISIKDCPMEMLKNITAHVSEALKQSKLEGQIKDVLLTRDKLIEGNDFKVSRKKLAKRLAEGKIATFTLAQTQTVCSEQFSELEHRIVAIIKKALRNEQLEISPDADFFTTLGGTSLDYFTLIDLIKSEFGVDLPVSNGNALSSVHEISEYIKQTI